MRKCKSLFGLFLIAFIMFYGLSSCGNADNQESAGAIPAPRNIIYFVGDGMGYNHVLAANYFEHGRAGAQVYEQDDWFSAGLATYSAARPSRGDFVYLNGYAPRTAWEDPAYVASDFTDSGAAATALSTGRKVYDGSIGVGLEGDTLVHVSQAAKALGKSVGIVSSVQLSHATPAGFIAHNEHRNNYDEIGRYMLFHTMADVIMAPGHPFFNNNGEPDEMSARYVGGDEIWEQLAANDGRTEFTYEQQLLRVQDVDGDGQRDPWTLVETREEFIALATGPAPKRVLGIPQVYSTLNQWRSGVEEYRMPFERPLNENVPTLKELTKASLNVLSQNDEGFFVMIEGGAIDWASHSGLTGRMIEEQIDFNNSVMAAVEWVETHSSWDETLIIVTSDHECGFLTGPDHPEVVKQDVVNSGRGELPEVKWNSGSHTNMLVPFYAKGPGTSLFNLMAAERDPVRGPFLQNTDVANAIFLMWGKPDIDIHRLN